MIHTKQRRIPGAVAVSSLATIGYIMSAASAYAASSLNFTFMASAAPVMSLQHQQIEPPVFEHVSQDKLTDGSVVTADDVLHAITVTPDTLEPGYVAPFGAGWLFAQLEDADTGDRWHYPLTPCETLDFELSDGLYFEQQVRCGEAVIGYSATDQGIVVTRDGEIMITIALDRGAYKLNGVPVIIK